MAGNMQKDMRENKIAAIVVTYNRKELLKQCIECLLGQKDASCDILVVDNASTDGTSELVSSCTDPRVKYRNTGENLGGAGGFNYGMRWAVEDGYEYVWIMDDDTLPTKTALAELLRADRILGGTYGFLSSAVLWTDGGECKMNRQKIKKNYYEKLQYMKDGIIKVEQATFVSLLIPVSVIKKAGLVIKEFFVWGDDIEYTRRLAVRYGYPCYMAGRSQVIHAMRENNGSSIATDDASRLNRYSYAFRNEAYLYRQEGISGRLYYLAKCGLNCFRIIAYRNKPVLKRLRIVCFAMIKGLFFRPSVEYVSNGNVKDMGTSPR